MKSLEHVNYLRKQYKDGPVENDAGQKTPYLEYLNAQLEEDTKKFSRTLADAKKKLDGWVSDCGISELLMSRYRIWTDHVCAL